MIIGWMFAMSSSNALTITTNMRNIIVLIIFCRSQSLISLACNPCNLSFIFRREFDSSEFSSNFCAWMKKFCAWTINIKDFVFFVFCCQCIQWPIKPTKCNYKAIIKKCAALHFILDRSVRTREKAKTKEDQTLMPERP